MDEREEERERTERKEGERKERKKRKCEERKGTNMREKWTAGAQRELFVLCLS